MAAVSVIMPAYNSEKYISAAIDSVISQTFTDWELVVIDDGSNDSTVQIVRAYAEKFPNIKLMVNEHNMGVTQTRNNGAEAASAEWIALLDSDDAWRADKLERQMALAAERGADLVFAGSDFMDENGESYGWTLHVPTEMKYKKLLKQNLISNSSVLVKKNLFLKYNTAVGMDITEDFACWIQMLRDGAAAVAVDEPLLIYRISRQGRSNNKFKSAKMTWGAYRFAGLNICQSIYYMCFYTVNGVLKYRNLKK